MDKEKIYWGVAAVAALASAWYGELPKLVQALILAMAMDVLTGIMAAIGEKRLNSSVGFKGLLKKCAMGALVWFAHQTDGLLGVQVSSLLTGAFLAVEAMSLFENAGRLGVNIPDPVRSVFEKLSARSAAVPVEAEDDDAEPHRPVGFGK